MYYDNILPATFLSRPNRFIAEIICNGQQNLCHVKNTGRCRELLLPNTKIFVQHIDNSNRKTAYDLISVYKRNRLINIDSSAPNRVAADLLPSLYPNYIFLKPEVTYKNSRFDFYLETTNEKVFIEIKGVTLENDNAVFFPDAPTERGVKHLSQLIQCTKDGYKGHIIFIIQMKGVSFFSPNDKTHPAFGEMLRKAAQCGVRISAFDCWVTKSKLVVADPVKIQL